MSQREPPDQPESLNGHPESSVPWPMYDRVDNRRQFSARRPAGWAILKI
jgi:hypothetical protein